MVLCVLFYCKCGVRVRYQLVTNMNFKTKILLYSNDFYFHYRKSRELIMYYLNNYNYHLFKGHVNECRMTLVKNSF